jgi:exportin-1
MTNYAALYDLQVCLDYWNSLVLELFEPHHNLDTPAATVNMMGLQVECIYYQMVVV